MSSYSRVALFVFFDAIERDLVDHIRALPLASDVPVLTHDEVAKASNRLERREGVSTDSTDHLALLHGLDLADKYAVLMRHKALLDFSASQYFFAKLKIFEQIIPVRNAIMHGRPLTISEFSLGFSVANEFLRSKIYWPHLNKVYKTYAEDPSSFVGTSISLLEDDISGETLNNLPLPDYEDTGFLSRPDLEKDLRKKILGRHPVITVLGDGGNGKTALTLQTLYGLLASNDHDFDAIVWVSAKTARLSLGEITRIEGAISNSLGIFQEIANSFEPGHEEPLIRVRRLMEDNKILLVIDNLESVLDEELRNFAADIPGQSKLVFTSRVPLGSDLSVNVGDLSEKEARTFLRRLTEAYDIKPLAKQSNDQLDQLILRLGRKPLLLKWFALGVTSGLEPDAIVRNIDIAIKFCMESVIENLNDQAKSISAALSVVPSAISAPVVQEITGMTSEQVEIGLAQLLRFGLAQRDEKIKDERVYQIRSFAKSYMTRVLSIDPTFSNEVLKRYRGIEGVFQSERGDHAFNRYDIRTFTVRNRSEALAARSLKEVMKAVNRNDISLAEALMQEIKPINSDYFETHRVDAFLAKKAGDIARAVNSYEAAIELADNQPQLHMFYAGLLSREMADYESARIQLDKAILLDPNAQNLIQESARNAFFAYDFDTARTLLNRVKDIPGKTRRNEIIFADLHSQLYCREADYLSRSGDYEGVSNALRSLETVLNSTPQRLIDQKHLDHIRKVYRVLIDMERQTNFEDKELLARLVTKINQIETSADLPASIKPDFVPRADDDLRIGNLRFEGRTPNFGFLRDNLGEDVYVNRAYVGSTIWNRLCVGDEASYTIARQPDGRSIAVNLKLVMPS